MSWLQTILKHGGNKEGINRLDEPNNPAVLPYTSLLARRANSPRDDQCLLAIYEWQEQPLVLLVDGESLDDAEQLRRIRRRAALHGDLPYLGVLYPGRLTVYSVALDEEGEDFARIAPPSELWLTLPWLAADRPQVAHSRKKWISDLILGLLSDALDSLIATGLSDDDAISLTGRALFSRFLADRGLIPLELHNSRGEEHLFDDPLKVHKTCIWLDNTFNGDLLPVSDGVWQSLDTSTCMALGHVMRRAKSGQLHLGWKEGWEYLDFAHIPVGVLSQAYEGYLRKHQPNKQDRQSSFFTPRPIADMLVQGSFHGLRRDGLASSAKVLDPAVGAGVFLISVYRQLVLETWREQGRRPGTEQLRDILYNQLCGFDIDEAALRFAALGLYLLAIEMDPQPSPVQKLRFNKDLRERVLFKLDGDDGLGSLGEGGSEKRHKGQYDLVIGNPPWSKVALPKNWRGLLKKVEGYVRQRTGTESPGVLIPDGAPDLGFVWNAGEWAKADGQIAFALHARLLFGQGKGMPEARNNMLRHFDVTGIVNGSALAGTRVWPNMNQQFCLWYARNSPATSASAFHYFNPSRDPGLTQAGRVRLDPSRSELIAPQQVSDHPWLLKTLFRGSRLDYELSLKIHQLAFPTLYQYWGEIIGTQGQLLAQAGNGYQRLRKSTNKPQSAKHLFDKPRLVSRKPLPPVIPQSELLEFDEEFVHRARRQEIYEAPLVLIPEAPYADKRRVCASISEQDLVFTESYYGLSAKGHPHAEELVRYLCLILRSKMSIWSALMLSAKFGVERETSESKAVLDMPVPPYESLSTQNHEMARDLFVRVSKNDSDDNWRIVDRWVAGLYGLDASDLQVVEDTLAFRAPYSKVISNAQKPPSSDQIKQFCSTLTNILQPWADDSQRIVLVSQPDQMGTSSPWNWVRLLITEGSENVQLPPPLHDFSALTVIADQTGSSELVHPMSGARGLWIGRLRQAHYWSASEARLLAERIVWEHADRLFD